LPAMNAITQMRIAAPTMSVSAPVASASMRSGGSVVRVVRRGGAGFLTAGGVAGLARGVAAVGRVSMGRRAGVRVFAAAETSDKTLELTEENVELVLDEVRPYLIADGGDVELMEIDGLVVRLKLKGACGSCPSSTVTMTMGIKKRLQERIPEILEVDEVLEEIQGMELNAENVELVRPGTGAGWPRPSAAACCTRAAPRVGHLSPPWYLSGMGSPLTPHARRASRLTPRASRLTEGTSQSPRPMQVLEEIRPYLVGTGGGSLELEKIDGVIVKIAIEGPAASVMTVRVAVTQKLREKIPGIAAVQLV